MSIAPLKVLITAGPTHEPIDPVRFIGNRSSGKMGISIAEEFAALGAEVILVKGPTELRAANASIKEVAVETAQEMFDAVAQYFQQSNIIVFAAAVADYTPRHTSPIKIKKSENELMLELVKTKDIAKEMGKLKRADQLSIGFALETNNELLNAQEKLTKKNFDLIVLNSMNDAGAGFAHDTNKVTLIDRTGNTTTFALKSKTEVAKDIVKTALQLIDKI